MRVVRDRYRGGPPRVHIASPGFPEGMLPTKLQPYHVLTTGGVDCHARATLYPMWDACVRSARVIRSL